MTRRNEMIANGAWRKMRMRKSVREVLVGEQGTILVHDLGPMQSKVGIDRLGS